MKIELDKDNIIETKLTPDQKVNIIFKTKKDNKTTVVLTASLSASQVEQLVAGLVSLKVKAK